MKFKWNVFLQKHLSQKKINIKTFIDTDNLLAKRNRHVFHSSGYLFLRKLVQILKMYCTYILHKKQFCVHLFCAIRYLQQIQPIMYYDLFAL